MTLCACCMFHYCWKTLNQCSTRAETSNTTSKNNNNNNNNKNNSNNSNQEDGIADLSTSIIVKRLLSVARPDAVSIFFAMVFLTTASLTQSVIPYYTGLVVNSIIAEKSLVDFNNSIMCMTMISLLSALSAGIRSGLFKFIFGRYKLRLQKLLFDKVIRLDISFFDSTTTGELMSRLNGDCAKIGDGLGLR